MRIFGNGIWTTILRFGSATGPLDTSGTGSPEGVVAAPIGSTFRRTDGGTNTATYRKETGAGSTGWVPNASSSGSLTDGDKGDITVSGSGTVLTVDAETLLGQRIAIFNQVFIP